MLRYRLDERSVTGDMRTPNQNPARVLFITSNGSGMGHLVRLVGIARKCGPQIQPIFVSLSQAVGVVEHHGFPYEYIPSRGALQVRANQWNPYFASRLTKLITTYGASGLVFDGIFPYQGLTQAIRNTRVRAIWVRRAMWKDHIPPPAPSKSEAFDRIIEPGDYAEALDTGSTSQLTDAVRVAPIVNVSFDDMLTRDDARSRLGLPPAGGVALVTLGAGNINDITDIQTHVIRSITSLPGNWTVALTKAPISDLDVPQNVTSLSVYPLAKYGLAFDFAVAAGGYNSFHESITARLPTIWIPNSDTQTDNQVARCEYAARAGIGISLKQPSSDTIERAVRELSIDAVRERMRSKHAHILREDGAEHAASIVNAVCLAPERLPS